MRPEPPGTLRLMRLAAHLFLLRRRHGLGVSRTPGKPTGFQKINRSLIWSPALTLFMMAAVVLQANLYVIRTLDDMGVGLGNFLPDPAHWPHSPDDGAAVFALGLFFAFTFLPVMAVNLAMAGKDLGKVEWDMEWFFTFPIPTHSILLLKAFESSLSNVIGWLVYTPLLFTIYFTAGHGLLAVPMALAGGLYLNFLLGLGLTVWETHLRSTAPLSRLKNFQAVLMIVGPLLFVAVVALLLVLGFPKFLVPLARRIYFFWLLVPPAVPVVIAKGGGGAVAGIAATAVWLALAVKAAGLFLDEATSDGLVATSTPYEGRRTEDGASKQVRLSGMVGKEMRLLWRDKKYLVTTMLFPLAFGAFQLVNVGLERGMRHGFRFMPVVAYGVAVFVLIQGASRILMTEEKAVWLLYTFPRSLPATLAGKALIWAVVGASYATLILLVAGILWHPAGIGQVLDGLIAVAAAFSFTFIAAATGISGTNPFAEKVTLKIPMRTALLQMLIAGLFGTVLVAGGTWEKLSCLGFFIMASYAMWTRTAEGLDVLLDRTEKPRRRIMLSDGVIAAFVFLCLLVVFTALVSFAMDVGPVVTFVLAYASAALVAGFGTSFILSVLDVEDMELDLGIIRRHGSTTSTAKAALCGLKWGAVASLVGVCYLGFLSWTGLDKSLLDNPEYIRVDLRTAEGIALGFVMVLVAPVFEEYVFRGLIYRGLRRNLTMPAAIAASAILFALLHHPASIPPVLFFGVVAAVAFEKAELLIAPVIAHFVYNLAVILAQQVF